MKRVIGELKRWRLRLGRFGAASFSDELDDSWHSDKNRPKINIWLKKRQEDWCQIDEKTAAK